MANSITHEWITEKADRAYASWTNKQVIRFHYFNPNGLNQRQRDISARLIDAIDAGKCNSGAYLVFNGEYHYEKMVELYGSRRPSTVATKVWIEMWEEKLQKAEKFLADCE